VEKGKPEKGKPKGNLDKRTKQRKSKIKTKRTRRKQSTFGRLHSEPLRTVEYLARRARPLVFSLYDQKHKPILCDYVFYVVDYIRSRGAPWRAVAHRGAPWRQTERQM